MRWLPRKALRSAYTGPASLASNDLPATWDDRCVVDGARGRREAMRQLAELRRRLAAAEDALADALAAMKRAEEAFDAASDRFDAAEQALDAAREVRAQARRERYAARQAHERAGADLDRLKRRVRELSGRVDRMLLPRSKPRAALPGAPVQHGLMTKHFPSDFYVTCATVIPVLFLAVAVQGRMYESVVRATRRADMTAFRYELMQSYLSGPGRDLSAPGRTRLLLRARADLASVATLALLYVAALILIAGGAGEALALWILYRGSEVSGGRPVVLGSTLVLVAVVVTAPFLTNWSAPSQRRQLASALISAATRPVKFRIDPGKAAESPAPRQDKEAGEP